MVNPLLEHLDYEQHYLLLALALIAEETAAFLAVSDYFELLL